MIFFSIYRQFYFSDFFSYLQRLKLTIKNSNYLNDVFNISTDDSINVDEIATMAIEAAGLNQRSVKLKYTGGDRGWKADVPIVRLSSNKLNSLGWKANFTSREAMKSALTAMYEESKR